MEYEIERHREKEYNVGDYFINNDGRLLRIIRSEGYKYALLDVGTGAHVSRLYPSIDELLDHSTLDKMTKVTQTSVAKFK